MNQNRRFTPYLYIPTLFTHFRLSLPPSESPTPPHPSTWTAHTTPPPQCSTNVPRSTNGWRTGLLASEIHAGGEKCGVAPRAPPRLRSIPHAPPLVFRISPACVLCGRLRSRFGALAFLPLRLVCRSVSPAGAFLRVSCARWRSG